MKKLQVALLLIFCLTQTAWVSKKPKDQEFMQKGYEAYVARHFNEAILAYEDVLALKPRNVDALNFLGVIYEEIGYPEKAEEKYLTAITINRRYQPAYLNLGLLYWNKADYEKAAYFFQKRIELGRPSDPWTLKAKAALIAIDKAKKEALLKHVEAPAPVPVKMEHENKPVAVVQSTKTDDRLKAINDALDNIKTPEVSQTPTVHVEAMPMPVVEDSATVDSQAQQAQALFTQGQQLAAAGQYQEAIAMYDRVLKITPGDPQVIKARVDTFLQWKQQATSDQ